MKRADNFSGELRNYQLVVRIVFYFLKSTYVVFGNIFFNFLARTLFGLIPLIAVLYMWRTIYQGKGAGAVVGSYSLAQMISYYLLVTIVDALTAVNEDDWQIAADIEILTQMRYARVAGLGDAEHWTRFRVRLRESKEIVGQNLW